MKILTKIKEIKSKTEELHFQRFAIIDCKYFGLYIHKIFKEDKDLHLHSHPWNFISLILKGSYVEKREWINPFKEIQHETYLKDLFTISKANTKFFHKIERIVKGPVWSLFFVYNKQTVWYYRVNDDLVESNEYRNIKNTIGFKNGK